MIVRAVGVDAAFANMGFAVVDVYASPGRETSIHCLGLQLLSTEKAPDAKLVRVSSDRLRRAQELREALTAACTQAQAQFAFVEVPSGTQNASAAFGLGIAVGVLASCPVPIIEVSPMEVKAAVAGRRVKKGASKAEVIAWAEARWPHAPWIRAQHRATSKGVSLPAGRLTNDNEHLADAMAAVVAGVATSEFQRLIKLNEHHATPGPDNLRLAPRRRAQLLLQV